MNLDDIKHIDYANFHFLRPQWLWLFVPMVVVLVLIVVSTRERGKWKLMIAETLRPYLFSKPARLAYLLPVLVFVIAMAATILAMAGPTWKKIEVPGARIQAVMLIALDMSQSMMATDVQPSRLERAKLKIIDLLDANPRARAGLLAVAGTTHPVLPVTADYNLVKHHAKSLQSWIMPVRGRNLALTMQVVDSVMRRVEAPSTLVLITDEVDAGDLPRFTNFVNNSPHRLEVLLVATDDGATVPSTRRGVAQKDAHGEVVTSRPDEATLQALAGVNKVTVNRLTLDKSDVQQIAKRIRDNLEYQKEAKASDTDWNDMGRLFVLPAVLLALYWFRRGNVIQWCWLGMMLCSCGVDDKHAAWWYTPDYQGQQLYNAGRFEDAADRFNDLPHKAAAAFKAGDYETAVDLFALDSSATGRYNQGLALAKLGRYAEADSLFGAALALNPALAQAAASRDKARAVKHRIDSVQQLAANNKNDKPLPKGKDKLKERKPQGKDEQLSADTERKHLPKTGDRATDEVQSNIHRARESDRPDTTLQKPGNDAQRILLQKISADPAEFLRRRFQLQKTRYYKNVKEGAVTW